MASVSIINCFLKLWKQQASATSKNKTYKTKTISQRKYIVTTVATTQPQNMISTKTLRLSLIFVLGTKWVVKL